MRRTILALPLAGLTLLGFSCAHASTTASPKPSTTVRIAPLSSRANMCYDGNCQVVVTGPVSFHVDPRFGIDTIDLWPIGSGLVGVRATGQGSFLLHVASPDSTATLNNLTIRVFSAAGRSVVRFSPS
jgi:hypothetical protein